MKYIALLLTFLLIPLSASAQVLESRLGRIEAGSDYVAYTVGDVEMIIPRDILEVSRNWSRPITPIDDLQMLYLQAQLEGKPDPVWTPAADDSILVLLDSIAVVATNVKSELNATKASLEAALADLDESRRQTTDLQAELQAALDNVASLQATIAANEETIVLLNQAVGAKDVEIAELQTAIEEERLNTQAFRRVVDQVARQILATLNEE